MRVCFYGNKQAGLLGLLTVLAKGHYVSDLIVDWQEFEWWRILTGYGAGFHMVGPENPVAEPKGRLEGLLMLSDADLFVCVHGWRIATPAFLAQFPLGGINLHPFWGKYPGLHPVKHALEAGEKTITITAHTMTAQIDGGIALAAESAPMPEQKTEVAVYNALYPLYAKVLVKTLDEIGPVP